MLNLAVTLVIVLLVVGLLLWAIDAMTFINANVKHMIHIVVIVFAVLYVIQMMAPVIRSALNS